MRKRQRACLLQCPSLSNRQHWQATAAQRPTARASARQPAQPPLGNYAPSAPRSALRPVLRPAAPGRAPLRLDVPGRAWTRLDGARLRTAAHGCAALRLVALRSLDESPSARPSANRRLQSQLRGARNARSASLYARTQPPPEPASVEPVEFRLSIL